MTDQSIPQKTCTKCGRTLPATAEYFAPRKLGKDGLRVQCRECRRKQRSENYANNPEHYRGKLYRYRDQHPEVVQKIYTNHNAKRRERYRSDPEFYRNQVYQWRAKHPDANRKACNRYYHSNQERFAEYNREWIRQNPERAKKNGRKRTARYRLRHPDRARESSSWSNRLWREKYPARAARYRKRLASLPNTLTDAQWDDCLAYFHHTCAYCGAQQSFWHVIELEHYIPISSSECPGTIAANVVPACRSCNSSKQNNNPEEWIIQTFGKRKGKQIIKRIQVYFESLE